MAFAGCGIRLLGRSASESGQITLGVTGHPGGTAAAAWIEPLLLPHIVSGAATGREGCLCYDAAPMPPIWINEDGQRADPTVSSAGVRT